jgi:hypothetical protein
VQHAKQEHPALLNQALNPIINAQILKKYALGASISIDKKSQPSSQ